MPTRQIAGIDLGSNSFHMVLGQVGEDRHVRIIDRHKEYVRLAQGLDADNRLSEASIERALACLERFAERLRSVPRGRIRCVGTNTLRRARNSEELLTRGAAILGTGIEVISGLEEARLIYKGVALDHSQPGRRLVVDIGGGSTEVITGDLNGPRLMDSIHMGCVSTTRKFFRDGRITVAALDAASIDARRKLAHMSQEFRESFDFALGASGTINAIGRVLTASYDTNGNVTREGVRRLRADLVAAGEIHAFQHEAISTDRLEVLVGGVAILDGVMAALEIAQIAPVGMALREGVLVEILGRESGTDRRALTVTRYQQRFEVDRGHAERVETTAVALFEQVAPAWFPNVAEAGRLLREAARLHEVGLFMGLSGFHKHGAYLVENSDLPGFSRQSQRALAALILCQRGRFSPSRLEYLGLKGAVDLRLAMLLRVAVRLNRGRRAEPTPVTASAHDGVLRLAFPPGWLELHALTRADVQAESARCGEAGLTLELAQD